MKRRDHSVHLGQERVIHNETDFASARTDTVGKHVLTCYPLIHLNSRGSGGNVWHEGLFQAVKDIASLCM